MSEPCHGDARSARYRAVALQALAGLSEGDTRPKTLHRARTHLRRLQAYFELTGRDRPANIIAGCVARLSKLRTLQVLARYLERSDAPHCDRKAVKRCIRERCRKLERKGVYEAVARVVRRCAAIPLSIDPDRMVWRMRAARRAHAAALRKLTAGGSGTPRRKTIHRLRLLIKSIRYQEEWALGRSFALPSLIPKLKRLQSLLGEHEDLFQFRRLASELDLQSASTINRDWRKARRRIMGIPKIQHVAFLDQALSGRELKPHPAHRDNVRGA